MTRDVFISHSAQDKAVADAICTAFEAVTITCWVAPRDVRPGHSFAGEITRAIRHSKVMVLIFSAHSNKSEQVLREVQLAIDCHLPIVQFRIENVSLSDDLTYFLSTPHWLDAMTLPLSKHVASLERAVKELLGQASEDAETNKTAGAVRTLPQKREGPARVARSRWKIPAIATAVALGAIMAASMFRQPKRENETKSPATSSLPVTGSVVTASPSVQKLEPTPNSVTTPTASIRSTPAPIAHSPTGPDSNGGLARVTNTRYNFSALVPQDVFPNPPATFSADRQTFTSPDGQTTLVLFVEPNNSPARLRESYERWAAQRALVDYKVLRNDWFVVSGEKNGRGFYVKAVAKRDVLAFMYFECDENNYPINKETLTIMSKSFNGN